MIQNRVNQYLNYLKKLNGKSIFNIAPPAINHFSELKEEEIYDKLHGILIKNSDNFDNSAEKIEYYLLEVDFYAITTFIFLEDKINESESFLQNIKKDSWYSNWNTFQKCIYLKLCYTIFIHYSEIFPGNNPTTNHQLFIKKSEKESIDLAKTIFFKIENNLFKDGLGWRITKDFISILKKSTEQYTNLNEKTIRYDSEQEKQLPLQKKVIPVDNANIDQYKDIHSANEENKTKTGSIESQTFLENNNQYLKEIFYPKAIDDFIKIETRLKDDRYFDENWKWKKNKIELVSFILFLQIKKYLRPIVGKNIRTHNNYYRRIFEKRYNVDIKKQMQPKQIEKYNLPKKHKALFFFIEIIE